MPKPLRYAYIIFKTNRLNVQCTSLPHDCILLSVVMVTRVNVRPHVSRARNYSVPLYIYMQYSTLCILQDCYYHERIIG